MSLYKLISRCPVEIAMAIFFGLYRSTISRLEISIIQSFTTICVILLIYKFVNFVLEISKDVCLGPDDDLIASSYGIVGGAIGFIIIYELIDMHKLKHNAVNEK